MSPFQGGLPRLFEMEPWVFPSPLSRFISPRNSYRMCSYIFFLHDVASCDHPPPLGGRLHEGRGTSPVGVTAGISSRAMDSSVWNAGPGGQRQDQTPAGLSRATQLTCVLVCVLRLALFIGVRVYLFLLSGVSVSRVPARARWGSGSCCRSPCAGEDPGQRSRSSPR